MKSDRAMEYFECIQGLEYFRMANLSTSVPTYALQTPEIKLEEVFPFMAFKTVRLTASANIKH